MHVLELSKKKQYLADFWHTGKFYAQVVKSSSRLVQRGQGKLKGMSVMFLRQVMQTRGARRETTVGTGQSNYALLLDTTGEI